MVRPRKAKAEGLDGAAHQIRQRQAREARLGVPRGAPASLARTFAGTARPALMTGTVAVGGQRGHGPPPASAGDPRSVAPRSMLALPH